MGLLTLLSTTSLPQQVKLIVQNALKLYSQDRTGMVDYALESGGKKEVSHQISACSFWTFTQVSGNPYNG